MMQPIVNIFVGSNFDGSACVKIENTYRLTPQHIAMIARIAANRAPNSKRAWIEFRGAVEVEAGSENHDNVAICHDLCAMNILGEDPLAWHTTFCLTDVGERVAKELPQRYLPHEQDYIHP